MNNITDERFRGSIGDLRAYQKPGLETFRRYIREELPAPPISRLTGMGPTEAGLGKATFTMPVTRWLEDGFGLYWGAYTPFSPTLPWLQPSGRPFPLGRRSRRLSSAYHSSDP